MYQKVRNPFEICPNVQQPIANETAKNKLCTILFKLDLVGAIPPVSKMGDFVPRMEGKIDEPEPFHLKWDC